MKFIMLLLANDKIPTIVGISTFISIINTIFESFLAIKILFQQFNFYEQLKFHFDDSINFANSLDLYQD